MYEFDWFSDAPPNAQDRILGRLHFLQPGISPQRWAKSPRRLADEIKAPLTTVRS
jgi:hypothetical protein